MISVSPYWLQFRHEDSDWPRGLELAARLVPQFRGRDTQCISEDRSKVGKYILISVIHFLASSFDKTKYFQPRLDEFEPDGRTDAHETSFSSELKRISISFLCFFLNVDPSITHRFLFLLRFCHVFCILHIDTLVPIIGVSSK